MLHRQPARRRVLPLQVDPAAAVTAALAPAAPAAPAPAAPAVPQVHSAILLVEISVVP